MSKLRIAYLAVNTHCNLNCAGCDGFCSLSSNDSNRSLESIDSDLRYLSCSIDLKRLVIMGGEPLLHPQIEYIIALSRLHFSRTEITVLSNGLVLSSMNEKFWLECKHNNVRVAVSYYPISGRFAKIAYIKSIARHYGVKFKEFSGAKSFEKTINIKGDSDPQKAINFCRGDIEKFCPILFNGKLYHCSLTAFVHIFNDHFKTDIPQPAGIDISDGYVDDELLSVLMRPCETCRFCLTESVPTTWGLSKKDINEWI